MKIIQMVSIKILISIGVSHIIRKILLQMKAVFVDSYIISKLIENKNMNLLNDCKQFY